jgi:hypothetical protein
MLTGLTILPTRTSSDGFGLPAFGGVLKGVAALAVVAVAGTQAGIGLARLSASLTLWP